MSCLTNPEGLSDPLEATPNSNQDETIFYCDGCEKNMLKNEPCWVFKRDAPIDFSGSGFCLCEPCYSDVRPMRHVDATLKRGPAQDFAEQANEISRCGAHFKNPSDPQEECVCRCAICNTLGYKGCEEVWYMGEAVLPSRDHIPYEHFFMLCPACLPNTVHDLGMRVSGEFSKKWFDPHLEKTTLEVKYGL